MGCLLSIIIFHNIVSLYTEYHIISLCSAFVDALIFFTQSRTFSSFSSIYWPNNFGLVQEILHLCNSLTWHYYILMFPWILHIFQLILTRTFVRGFDFFKNYMMKSRTKNILIITIQKIYNTWTSLRFSSPWSLIKHNVSLYMTQVLNLMHKEWPQKFIFICVFCIALQVNNNIITNYVVLATSK